MSRPAPTALDELVRLRDLGVNPAAAMVLAAGSSANRLRATGRPAAQREHGSEKGWRQHRTDGTPACRPCRAAHSLRVRGVA